MKRLTFLVSFMVCVLFFSFGTRAQDLKGLVIDDFEGAITGGVDGTVDFGAGNGSSVIVTPSTEIKQSGNQAIKVEYQAVAGGYIWVARGYDLDVKGAACWLHRPEDINWKDYNAIAFYMYGSNSKTNIAFDIKDYREEIWRFIIPDDFIGWKQVVCPFAQFFCRTDWQPNSAEKNNELDFPLKSFQFEPLPESKGVVYFDILELVQSK